MKKLKRSLVLLSSLVLMVVVLSGCTPTTKVDASSTGFWDHYIVWNFIRAIQGLSHIFGNSYGWGIVIFTIIVRIIILPLMIYQYATNDGIATQIKSIARKISWKRYGIKTNVG